MKICSKCKETKSLDDFGKDSSKPSGKQSYCKLCVAENWKLKQYSPLSISKEYREEYYKLNKTELLNKQKIYKEKNKTDNNEYQKEYRKNRRLTDVNFRLNETIRTNIARIFKAIGTKKENKSYQIVNYTAKELKQHIELQFLEGMTWDNYGSVWEIDHITPINWYVNNQNKFNDKNNLCREANSLSNLKPLFFLDNRTKGSSY